MTKYKVTCTTNNCENENLEIEINAPVIDGIEQDHINAICGACSQQITQVEHLTEIPTPPTE